MSACAGRPLIGIPERARPRGGPEIQQVRPVRELDGTTGELERVRGLATMSRDPRAGGEEEHRVGAEERRIEDVTSIGEVFRRLFPAASAAHRSDSMQAA